MHAVLGEFKKISKLTVKNKVNVDGVVPFLYYRVTCLILALFLLLVSCTQYFGEPIRCIQDVNGDDAVVPEKAINTYCFIKQTYTMVDDPKLEYGVIKKYMEAHPGVRPDRFFAGRNKPIKQEKRVHSYYQWVPFILVIQMFMFYLPHVVWKNWEGGVVKKLLENLQEKKLIHNIAHIKSVAKYVVARLHSHGFLLFAWLFYDILNILNLFGNAYVTNLLLGGKFLDYGYQVLKFLTHEPSSNLTKDPFNQVFPKVTKCSFHMYGPSGSVQNLDSLCIMTLNIVNEKLYAFLWFWYIVLAVVSVLGLLIKLGILTSIKMFGKRYVSTLLEYRVVQTMFGLPGPLKAEDREWLVKELDITDGLFLHLIVKNMDQFLFPEFMEKLIKKIKKKSLRGPKLIKK